MGAQHNDPVRPGRTTSFERMAGWSYRRRWWALSAWVLVLIVVGTAAHVLGAAYHNDFSLPGTQSQQALDALEQRAPARAGATVQIVVQDGRGVDAPDTRQRVAAMLDRVRGLPHVADVHSLYGDPMAVARDGTIGYATVTLDRQAQDVPSTDIRRIIDTAKAAEGAGLSVELGGDAVVRAEKSGGGAAEGVGLLAALIILVVMFGSLLAAAVPIVIAVFAVGSAISALIVVSHVATVADYTTPVMILVGLGVGIDYALLLLSRFRAELATGASRDVAVRRAFDTAGRTVFFAGCTVIIALLGLAVLGLGSLQGVAIAVALTVFATMLASLTLLPALLSVVGARIERAVAGRGARARASEGARWRNWTALVQRHPWPAAVLAIAALVLLAIPAIGMRLGFADAGNGAPTRTSRQAYDLLARGFGPGFNGPLVVVVEGDPGAATAAQHAIATTPGVASASPVVPTSDPQTSTIIVVPDAKPQDARTRNLLNRLRTDVLPLMAHHTGAVFLVGGTTAATADFASAVASRLALFVLVVVGLSALLLMVVFRSVLIPIKAAVLNLLSVGAALGVITLVFQHGVLGRLIGVQSGPIEAFVPVMIFAIAFGLSMDYEVFLLSRMHEEWRRTGDARRAIREGMTTTGRVVTAAAAIMVVVFASFLLDPSRMLKQFGLGLAVAVVVDALVIRCVVLPAVMQLFGRWAWWMPDSLRRVLPRAAFEHEAPPAVVKLDDRTTV